MKVKTPANILIRASCIRVFNDVKFFAENFSAFLTEFDRHQQKEIDLPTSVHLNSERESHAKEIVESNLLNNDLTSPEEQQHYLRLKNLAN